MNLTVAVGRGCKNVVGGTDLEMPVQNITATKACAIDEAYVVKWDKKMKGTLLQTAEDVTGSGLTGMPYLEFGGGRLIVASNSGSVTADL